MSPKRYYRHMTPAKAADIRRRYFAREAGIYEALWRPDEIGITKAHQLIAPLTDGLARLRTEPDKYRALNSPNGWGSYEGLVRFVEDYLNACGMEPDADVRVWR